MSTARNTKSISVPRYRLSTFFILFACAAVGLATTRDVLAATWVAIKAAMVVGLLQQTRELSKRLPENGSSAQVWHARAFAIAWRLAAAAGLLFFLILELTSWNIALLYPDREVPFLYEPATAIADLPPIVVLANSVRRWRPSISAGSPRHLGWWITAGVLLLIAASNVIDAGCIEYLVHQATAGMEAGIKPEFQRPGVYPDHASEGFRSFWISFAAAAMVPLGAAFLMSAANRWNTPFGKLSWAAFVVCLAMQLVYCVWFYTIDYPRLSPELAGAGFAARNSDLFAGVMLLVVLATPAAYFLTALPRERSVVSDNLAVELDSRSIHETAPVLIVLGLWGAINLVMSLVSTFSHIFFPVMSLAHLNPWMKLWMNSSAITSPLVLMLIVPSLLALQLCYYRWKRRRECVPWELPALPGLSFAWNWLSVATAIAIGTPTLAAFGFMFWLGPFNFSGL